MKILIGLFTIMSCFSGNSFAEKTITLATAEREPYIGANLRHQGYVSELVTAVFQQAGYNVDIKFLPWARALVEVKNGSVDGIMPAYLENKTNQTMVFSDPFPGDHLGLLKKKSLQHLDFSISELTRLSDLNRLKGYRFGFIRGISVTNEFDEARYLNKFPVSNNTQLLDMLDADRIDFAVIDKYTAASIMINKRPHFIGQMEFTPLSDVGKSFHIAFSKKTKDYQQRINDFNRGLRSLKSNGTLTRLRERHGLFSPKSEKQGITRLVIGTVNNTEMTVMRSLSKEYEKNHPDIELEWRVIDEGTLRDRLLSDLAISDNQFDIMTIGSFEAHFWSQKNWLMPLDNLPVDYDIGDILKPFRDVVSHNNRLYALPFYGESLMTYYRKDLFEAAAMQMPEAPTYKEILEFARRLHQPQQEVYGLCIRGLAGWGANMSFFNTMLNTHGGRWFDEQWNTEILGPEWRAALTLYLELVTQYGPPGAADNNFNENKKLFSEGKCAIWIDATVAASALFDPKQSQVHNSVGYALAPTAVTAKGASWVWSWSLAIPTSSKFSKEALDFIAWATSKDYIKLVAKHHGWLSIPPGTRLSSYKNKHYQSAAPFAKFVLSAIQSSNFSDNTLKPTPYKGNAIVYIPEYPALGHQVGLQINKLIRGKQSINQTLENSDRLVSTQMRSSGYTQ